MTIFKDLKLKYKVSFVKALDIEVLKVKIFPLTAIDFKLAIKGDSHVKLR